MSERVFNIDELDDFDLFDGSELVTYHEQVAEGRWTAHEDVVFRAPDDGHEYLVHMQRGLTEYQDLDREQQYTDASYERDTGRWWVSCPQVETYQALVPVTKWREL